MFKRLFVPVLAAAAALALFAGSATPAQATNWGHQGGAGYHPGGSVHCVRHGETMYRIAAMHGVTVHALAAANGIWNPNYIRAGQCLTIPSGGHYGGHTKPVYHQPQAKKVGGHGGYGGYQKPVHSKPGYGHNVYCVRYGDTLWSIAWRYGVSAWSIANANGIKNPNYIRAGHCLTIPAW